MLKPLTSSIYSFEKLRNTGMFYVDKTEFIHKLVRVSFTGSYFYSRPRRFGKSLTLSTLKAVFQGRRDLFEGLAIDKLDYDWKEYPVIHLDMSQCIAPTPDGVITKLHEQMDKCAQLHGVSIKGAFPESKFDSLIFALSRRAPVVILIDEYDKPLLEKIDEPEVAVKIRDILRNFYIVAKATDELQRFLFITGVVSFPKVSFFSDLNHLTDLSRDERFATMLGYTQEELEENFSEYIEIAAGKNNLPREGFLDKFKQWYNGFCFCEDAPTVYNPVSTAKFFEKNQFDEFWFTTGTMNSIVRLAKKTKFNFASGISDIVFKSSLDHFDVEKVKMTPLLFQSGYFTIKGAFDDNSDTCYKIGFPNYEVETAFEKHLLTMYLGNEDESDIRASTIRLREALAGKNCAAVVAEINAQLATIPGKLHEPSEAYYHTVVAMMLRYAGVAVRVEEWVSTGIIDNTVRIGNLIYVFEFKIDKTAAAAMKQIHDKNYYAQWLTSGKEIILLALAFDSEKKIIGDMLVEEIQTTKTLP